MNHITPLSYRNTAYSLLVILFALTTLAACTSREPDYLEQSLQLAGENRGELEFVTVRWCTLSGRLN